MPEYRVVRTAIDKTNTNNLDKSAIFRPRRRRSERNKQGVTLVTAHGYNFCRALHLPKIEKQTQIYYQSDYKMDAIFNPPRKKLNLFHLSQCLAKIRLNNKSKLSKNNILL